MMSVLLNCSEVNFLFFFFKRGGVWRPHPPPTATPKHPRVLFHLLPGGKQLLWVWLLLLVIRALSGRLHEARQTFARQ